MALTTLLFDLDGTLLPLDQEVFLRGYLAQLLPKLAHLEAPQLMAARIMSATMSMIQSPDLSSTNEQTFRQDFFKDKQLPEDELWALFEAFYEKEFEELAYLTNPSPISAQLLEQVVADGYEIILATNPIFPKAAILHRMKWAGIDQFPWKLITSLEVMHACKPNISYYEEILQLIGRQPEECMMIGNHALEDMIAHRLGLKTFLVTDLLLDEAGSRPEDISFQGTLNDVLTFFQTKSRQKEE